MKSETEIVNSLLKNIKNQLGTVNHAEYSLIYNHPKFGDLTFTLNTREIDDVDFEKGTLALDFAINKCVSSLKAGKKDKILIEIEKYLADPEPILEDIPNYYRLLFDHP